MALIDVLKTFNEEKIVVKQPETGKYVEKDAEGISLKGVLQRGRLKFGKEKQSTRQGLTFSPSSITYQYCKRLKVGQLAGLTEIYYDKPAPRLQLTFDLGHAIHDIFQGYFWDLGILRGAYKCLKCDKIYDNILAPDSCPSGIKSHTRSHLKYKEVKATNAEYRISGRCDGILEIEGEYHLVDIKSIANRTPKSTDRQWCFEDLATKGPKPDHIAQITMYMWMLQTYKAHLLYVSKNDGQIKSFAIPYDEGNIRSYLDEIEKVIKTAEALKEGKKVELPPCCDDEKCKCYEILPQLV